MARHKPAAGKSVSMRTLPAAATTSNETSEAVNAQSLPHHASARLQPVQRICGVRIVTGGEWSGVSLRLADGQLAGHLLQPDLMELSLVTPDGRSITFAVVDGDEAVAVWRAASAATGLAMMVETTDGLLQSPFPQIGRLMLGAVRIRRAHGIMNGRRPRFLQRRKASRMPERPIMVHGEALSGGF